VREHIRIGRALAPWLLGLLVLAITLFFWRALVHQEEASVERVLKLKAAAVTEDLRTGMDARLLALLRMARRWESLGRPPREAWAGDARRYMNDYPGYVSISWLDETMEPRWTIMAADSPVTMPRRTYVRAAGGGDGSSGLQVATVPWESGHALVAMVRLRTDGQGDGYLAGTFDSHQLIESILAMATRHQGYRAEVGHDGTILYRSSSQQAVPADALATTELRVYGFPLALRVWPEAEQLAEMRSMLPQVILIAGILLAAAIGLIAHLAQTAGQRAAELQRENTERRRAEQALAQHTLELERSNRDLEQFAYVASHDLQEPLRIVTGYVELLQRRYGSRLDADADRFIGHTVDAVQRMQSLIQGLLTYSRAGRRREPVEVDLCRVVDDVIRDLGESIDASGALITRDPLPTVIADELQMLQLFANLMGNALKYRGEDAPPRIHIGAEHADDGWRISVQDNGIGIEARHAERIFAIFQRLHGRSRYEGTGIGLAICRKVVENQGGRIWVESTPGEGSAFYFTLPGGRDGD